MSWLITLFSCVPIESYQFVFSRTGKERVEQNRIETVFSVKQEKKHCIESLCLVKGAPRFMFLNGLFGQLLYNSSVSNIQLSFAPAKYAVCLPAVAVDNIALYSNIGTLCFTRWWSGLCISRFWLCGLSRSAEPAQPSASSLLLNCNGSAHYLNPHNLITLMQPGAILAGLEPA